MEHINNIFNLNYLGKSKISLSKAVLLFYLLIGNNYTNELFSGQLSDFIKGNRYAQHFIGYVTMMAIINNIGGVSDVTKTISYSLIAYLWFIFTTKLDLQWSLLIIGFMVFSLLYESTMTDKEIKSENDESLKENNKEKIRSKHNKLKMGIAISALIITTIGMAGYFDKKKIQYGGNFDEMKFLFNGSKRY